MEILVADGEPAGVSSKSRAVTSYSAKRQDRTGRPIGEIGLDKQRAELEASNCQVPRCRRPKSISPSWLKVTRAASNPGTIGWAETDSSAA